MNSFEKIADAEWYAITNLGTGKNDPHSVILRTDNINGFGASENSLEEAIDIAHADLITNLAKENES